MTKKGRNGRQDGSAQTAHIHARVQPVSHPRSRGRQDPGACSRELPVVTSTIISRLIVGRI